MSRLMIVTQPSLVVGFQLAGVEAFMAKDVDSAQELIESWIKKGEEGLLAIDEGLLANMETAFLGRLQAAQHLPYLPIPAGRTLGPSVTRRQRIADMIRRAIGFHITFAGETEMIDGSS